MREVAGKIGEKVGVRELPEAQGGIRHSIILPMEEPTRPDMWCSHSKRAKAVSGNWREMEPRFTHDILVNLLQPKAEAASKVIQGETRVAW